MQDNNELLIQIEKRIQTTMIGAISKMENNFGYLWGHFKDESQELTEAEEKFADLWDFTRNQILNQGNTQIRNLRNDFAKYGGQSRYRERHYYNFGKPRDT